VQNEPFSVFMTFSCFSHDFFRASAGVFQAARTILETWNQGTGVNPMLDLFYVAVGCVSLYLFWKFAKACDKL
jgi:hypothetical protein